MDKKNVLIGVLVVALAFMALRDGGLSQAMGALPTLAPVQPVLPWGYPGPVEQGRGGGSDEVGVSGAAVVPVVEPGAGMGANTGEGTEGGMSAPVVGPKWAVQPDENPGDYCLMQVGVLLRYEPRDKSILPHAEIPPGVYMYREKTQINAPGWLLVSGMGQLGWVRDGECR